MKKGISVALLLLIIGFTLIIITGIFIYRSTARGENEFSDMIALSPERALFNTHSERVIDTGDKEPIQTMNWNANELESLEVRTDFCQLQIETSDNDTVSVDVYRIKKVRPEPEITFNGGTLEVTREVERKRLQSFDLFMRKEEAEYAIKIKIPKVKTLDEFLLRHTIGKCSISGVNVKDFSAECGVGATLIKKMKIENFEFIGGVGNVRFEDLDVAETSITSGVGSIVSNACRFRNLEFEGGVGAFIFDGRLTGDSSLHTGIGETKLTLRAPASDYNVFIESGIGHARIDHKSAKFFDNTKKCDHVISAEIGIGNFDIMFEP